MSSKKDLEKLIQAYVKENEIVLPTLEEYCARFAAYLVERNVRIQKAGDE